MNTNNSTAFLIVKRNLNELVELEKENINLDIQSNQFENEILQTTYVLYVVILSLTSIYIFLVIPLLKLNVIIKTEIYKKKFKNRFKEESISLAVNLSTGPVIKILDFDEQIELYSHFCIYLDIGYKCKQMPDSQMFYDWLKLYYITDENLRLRKKNLI